MLLAVLEHLYLQNFIKTSPISLNRNNLIKIKSCLKEFSKMHRWNERNRPFRLERRFEFDNYELTRNFLDKLGDFCEKSNRFPDISFGKTYVNINLFPENTENNAPLTDADHKFASEIDQLVD